MKKRMLFTVLLALVLTLCFVMPAAAKGNIYDRYRENETSVYEWWSGPYLVTDVFHTNWQETTYTDLDYTNSWNSFWIQTWYLDGAKVGVYKEVQRWSWTDNVGNDIVFHTGIMGMEGYNGYLSMYQVVYNYANGKVRVNYEKIQ